MCGLGSARYVTSGSIRVGQSIPNIHWRSALTSYEIWLLRKWEHYRAFGLANLKAVVSVGYHERFGYGGKRQGQEANAFRRWKMANASIRGSYS
jgi:hypothetical protein